MLKFIGVGSAFNSEMGNTSAYIKKDQTVFVFDCGELAFARMKQLNLFDDVKNVYIFITHTHSDHVGSLGSMVQYLNIYKDIVPNLILSTNESADSQAKTLKTLLEIYGCDEEKYEFTYADMLEDVLPDLKDVKMVEVKHSKMLVSYAIELYFKDQTIYYVGDNNDKQYLKHIAKKLNKNDLVYTDCTNLSYKNSPHISISELCEIFDKNVRGQICTMHFDSYSSYNEAKNEGFAVATREFSKEELLRQLAGRK